MALRLPARELVPELAEIPCIAIDDLDLTDAPGNTSTISPASLHRFAAL